MAENEMTFEAAMARLEAIVHALEDGEATLDASLGLFEEGIGLVKLCNSRLERAEQKVKMLVADENNEMVERDFVPQKQD
jgi:exodeoxyribonuclease VII small subunit